jgi:Malectin domain
MKVINFLVDALLGFGKGDISPKSTVARVTGLRLIQPKTGAVLLSNISNGTIFYHDDNNEFSVQAVTSDGPLPIQGVQFDWNGKRNYRTDRFAPYALCRRTNPSCVSNGAHIITATGLNKEIPFRVQFAIVRGQAPDAAMPSTPMPMITPTEPPKAARDSTVAPQAKPTSAPRSAPVASPVLAPVAAPKTVPVSPPRTVPKATAPKAAPVTAPKASPPVLTPSAAMAPLTAPSAIAPTVMIAPVSAPSSAIITKAPVVAPTMSPSAAPVVLPTTLAPVVRPTAAPIALPTTVAPAITPTLAPTSMAAPKAAPTATSAWGPAIMLINCGGENYTDTTGRIWRADAFFSGGATSKVNKSIAGTDDDVLYASERFGKSTYNVPLPAGEYVVVLHMAEL